MYDQAMQVDQTCMACLLLACEAAGRVEEVCMLAVSLVLHKERACTQVEKSASEYHSSV